MRTSVLLVVSLLVIPSYGRAQDSGAQPAAARATVTVPAGTTLYALLERPISTRSAKPGDRVYLQTAHPVVVKNEIVIPAGTYVEATLDTIAGRGWINRRIELRLHVTRLLWPNGYVIAASNSMQGASASNEGIESNGLPPVSTASVTSVAAPIAGTAIGAVSDGVGGAIVGGYIGGAIGAVASIIAIKGGSDVTMDSGSPLDLVLQNPLTLDEARATAPGSTTAYTVLRAADQRERRCYDPGTPGTPDIIIPGNPGTPAMGDIPGTPPTPDTTIPGTPATPGFWHRCS
jgi:hypothetical protein